MRRWLLPALMITLLLTGCGGSAAERGLAELQTALRGAQEIRCPALITANVGDEVFLCTMDCRALPERVEAAITAPETVAGIRVAVAADGSAVEYEGISLGVGADCETAVSPVSSLPLLLSALRGGSVQRAWTEREGETALLVREYFLADDLTLRVWYDGETFLPKFCEFLSGGSAVLRCEVRDFRWISDTERLT